VHAAYVEFGAGLRISLEISGALLCAGALIAAVTVRNVRRRAEELAAYEASIAHTDGGHPGPADEGDRPGAPAAGERG
jgi:hypothetical protein